MSPIKVNIIVLNYNGENIIPRCLPSIIEAAAGSRYATRVTVIDNESTDGSIEVLRGFGENIEILPLKNRVLCSFNDAVASQEEDVAILLNNDMKVDRGFVDPLVQTFEDDPDAFLSCPKCYSFDGETLEGGRSRGFIKYGWFGALARYEGWMREIDQKGYTFQSGFGAVRKDKFLELGGYDDLYLPGRLEDSDIGFRAWKKGWKSYYCPGSVVYHMGGETFNKEFGDKGVSEIDSRNSLFFFWKNISDPLYWAQHIFFFPARIVWWAARGDIGAVKGAFKAIARMREVMGRRSGNNERERSDRAVFDLFKI